MDAMTNEMLVECAVITFGCNDDGQLGRGERRRWTTIDDVTAANYPQQVGVLRGHDVVAASCGSRHSMVLTSHGEVFSWGWGAVRAHLSLSIIQNGHLMDSFCFLCRDYRWASSAMAT